MKRYYKIVKMIFKSDKKILSKCIAILILLLGVEAFIPLFMEKIVNDVEIYKNYKKLVFWVVIFAFIYLLSCLIDAFRAKYYQYVGKHLLWEIRKKFYYVIWRSDYRKNVQTEKERLKFVLNTQTYLMFAISIVYSLNVIVNFFIVILFLVISMYINKLVTLILIVSVLMTLGLSFFSGKKILEKYDEYNDEREKDSIINNENIDMIEVTRTNGLEDYYLEKNRNNLDSFIEMAAKSEFSEAFWSGLEKAIHCIIYVLVSGVLVCSEKINGGALVSALFITNYLLEVSGVFQRQVQVIIKNISVFDKVFDVIETPIEDGVSILNVDQISFENVSLKYDERNIVSNISFEINKGDKIIVEGDNGSGKSTIIKMIMGLIRPTTGNIKINGNDIDKINTNSLYNDICYISQDELLLNETLENYVRIITHRKIEIEELIEMRNKVRLNPEIEIINDNGRKLSGGEKKKILLLKALMSNDRNIIIFDEIDAGLDSETKQILQEIEKEILADNNRTFIKISHIDNNKEGFDKIIHMK